MKQLSVYAAGAMECYGTSNGAKAWRQSVKEIFEKNSDDFVLIDPTDYYEYGKDHQKSEREVMRFDLRKVRDCDILLVNLENIRKSVGTIQEVMYAYTLGKPIIGFLESEHELSEKELVALVHPWIYEEVDRIETDVDALYKACGYIIDYYGR